ncbi:MAG: NTP transferase domain-containing protein [Duncaniella sp.]|nr:NTP transferase domain-containing protein [Duncaniella sp.]
MKNHTIRQSATIIEALSRLNDLSGGLMTLLVTAPDGSMAGTLTDGDVRRALLRGLSLTSPVEMAMKRDYRFIRKDDPDTVATIRRLRQLGLRLIPILDDNGHILRIIDTSVTSTLLPLRAILMAGGKGERLRPLTLETPKPLLPVGGRAIIDHNIASLAAAGIDHISVTVNYLAEKIEQHFATPVAGVSVRCIREPRQLGTIGSALLCDIPPEGQTLVMNSDLLTTISFEDMYIHHAAEQADITIAAIPYSIPVPYAILSTEGSRVKALEEKPSYTYYANAGIYIISNHLLRNLPPDERTDATDLIDSVIASGGKVTFYPISGTWIDIGTPADYAHACQLMKHIMNTPSTRTLE